MTKLRVLLGIPIVLSASMVWADSPGPRGTEQTSARIDGSPNARFGRASLGRGSAGDIVVPSAPAPEVVFGDARPIETRYKGTAKAVLALTGGSALPTALAAGDFDRDGVADLVCSYAVADGGLLAVHRGNVDAIFTDHPDANRRKIDGSFTGEPFLSPATVLSVGVRPDFMVTGDFDADGLSDIVIASRGGSQLGLLPGDGAGGFLPLRRLALAGAVTALIAGEINRPDGLSDLIVGIDGDDGPEVLVFEGRRGAFLSVPETLALASPATGFVTDQLDGRPGIDLAVAAGHELLIVHGRDRRLARPQRARQNVAPSRVDHLRFSSPTRSVESGHFVQDPRPRGRQLAVLLDDGRLQVLGNLDGRWQELDEPRVSRARFRADGVVESRDLSGSVSLAARLAEIGGEVVAVLPMRLNDDGQADVVVLSTLGGPLTVQSSPAAVFVVTNVNDAGAGSLRQAILDANANGGADAIDFDIPGSGPHFIVPSSPLPPIVSTVAIDGASEPDFAGTPVVVLVGSSAGDANGLTLAAGSDGSVIRSLNIRDFSVAFTCNITGAACVTDGDCPTIGDFCDDRGLGRGILIQSNANRIEGNFVGTDETGMTAAGNLPGVVVDVNVRDNIIGGTVTAARNLISGNDGVGVGIDQGSSSNLVRGNFIGVNVTGASAIGNRFSNILIFGNNNSIGGDLPGARNVIAGSGEFGIAVAFDAAFDNVIQDNLIGIDANGTAALPNTFSDILVVDASFTLIGGGTSTAGNVISGSAESGVFVVDGDPTVAPTPTSNSIEGNLIGTDISGMVGLGNGFSGVFLEDADDSLVAGNVVSGNSEWGIVQIDFDTTVPLVPAQIVRNIVGMDALGAAAIPNAFSGLVLQGVPSTMVLDNLISANNQGGIAMFAGTRGTIVERNIIGADITGAVSFGNANQGILLSDASNNFIGNGALSDSNQISFNGLEGLAVADTTPGLAVGNVVSVNRIFDNGLRGIDLFEAGVAGVTVNDFQDPDAGPDGLQNYPVITGAETGLVETVIRGTLNSRPNTSFNIELFSNPTTGCDPSGHGEGEVFLGRLGVMTDANGDAILGTVVTGGAAGDEITATATNADGTSEFSMCLAAAPCSALITFPDTIFAPDANSVTWVTPADVAFAIFDLGALPIFNVIDAGLGFGTTSVDLSAITPAPGTAVGILTRPWGCGSWQSALGAEPDRDIRLMAP